MAHWVIMVVLGLACVAIAVTTMWQHWLDTKRRMKALDVVQAAIEQGREPPKELLADLAPQERNPFGGNDWWANTIVFTVLSLGFGAFALIAWRDGNERFEAFGVIALVMGATAMISLITAVMKSRRAK
jgi:hypothetical protein